MREIRVESKRLVQGSRLSVEFDILVTYKLLQSVVNIRSYAARCGVCVCYSVQRILLHK